MQLGAQLTLPDGSSRASGPRALPGDLAAKQQGGCIDVQPGTEVTLQTARRQTSIVMFDGHDGRGVRSFVVPNVDFGPAGAVAARAGGDCLSYNVPVTLRGTVTMGSTYGEDTHGHTGTMRWEQITLDRPICTRESPATYEEAEQDVRAIEPAWMGKGKWPAAMGQHVTVEGQLYHRDNANQMTKVLISTDHVVPDR